MESKNTVSENSKYSEEVKGYILNDLDDGISHGILVSNLAGLLAKAIGLSEQECQDVAVAGFLHDIGKLQLSEYLYGRNDAGLSIEEMKYMRMHPKLSFEVLKHYGYSDDILEMVLRHHESYDGSGYPGNLKGDDIHVGARIIRVVDAFAALIADRPYRSAFDIDTAVDIMIDEVKNLDMRLFIEFQRLIHEPETLKLIEDSTLQIEISLED